LAGCGGGSSNNSNNSSGLNDAQFVDAPVAGVDYKTDSINGVTNDEGFFQYNSTDAKISFYVGSLKIGEFNLSNLKSDKIILPADLFGLDRNNTTDDKIVKVIVFLQSLDSDNNPNNGITIDDNVKDKITDLLENNTTIKTSLSENNYTVIKDIIKSSGKKMILENVARNNYKDELIKLGYKPDFMPFTTVWEVKQDDLNITIPINPDYAVEYNYTVDWGDGSIDTEVNDSITHTYANDGNYTIKIYGNFPAIYLHCDNYRPAWEIGDLSGLYNANKLIKILKWGDIKWKSMFSAFFGAINMTLEATDTPDLSQVSNMREMFRLDIKFNSNININDWNVSNVTDMGYLFSETLFNQPLDKWDVSNVKDMSFMFYSAPNFNQDISNWDVNNVTDMSGMFADTHFNKPLNDWNVSNVENMHGMFNYNTAFNQSLDKWDVSNVKDMGYMFFYATNFNQDISDWNTNKVTNMDHMFSNTPFNKPLNDWNVSNVENMNGMFDHNRAFNQPLDKWDVSNVKYMGYMFSYATNFNQDISDWNVSNVTYYDGFANNCPIDGTDKMPHFQ